MHGIHHTIDTSGHDVGYLHVTAVIETPVRVEMFDFCLTVRAIREGKHAR